MEKDGTDASPKQVKGMPQPPRRLIFLLFLAAMVLIVVLMVIDSVKGVESQTKKLLEVCRLRHTPIMTFINKLDREGREPIDLLDDIESSLNIQCAPMTWPIGMGKRFRGTYHLYTKEITFYDPEAAHGVGEVVTVKGLDDPRLDELLGSQVEELRADVELLEGAAHPFDIEQYLAGKHEAPRRL